MSLGVFISPLFSYAQTGPNGQPAFEEVDPYLDSPVFDNTTPKVPGGLPVYNNTDPNLGNQQNFDSSNQGSFDNQNPLEGSGDANISDSTPGVVFENHAPSEVSPSGVCSPITSSVNGPLAGFVANFLCFTNKFFVPILGMSGLLLFIWGVTQYVINANNEEAREKGRQVIMWGIIALTVMVTLFGLVRVLVVTLGIETGVAIPQLK